MPQRSHVVNLGIHYCSSPNCTFLMMEHICIESINDDKFKPWKQNWGYPKQSHIWRPCKRRATFTFIYMTVATSHTLESIITNTWCHPYLCQSYKTNWVGSFSDKPPFSHEKPNYCQYGDTVGAWHQSSQEKNTLNSEVQTKMNHWIPCFSGSAKLGKDEWRWENHRKPYTPSEKKPQTSLCWRWVKILTKFRLKLLSPYKAIEQKLYCYSHLLHSPLQ